MFAIANLIAEHRAAVVTDEANFTAECEPIDEAAADASGDLEIEAYRKLIGAPCTTAADVQAKIGYLLNGSVGVRTTLIECLITPCYAPLDRDDSLEILLRSLLTGAES